MPQHDARVFRPFVALMVLAAVVPGRLTAQTNDEARLTLGISAGFIASTELWDIRNQPVASVFGTHDIYHLHRESHADFSISGHAAFYRGPHLGFTGEFTYVGLGTSDFCDLVENGGDAELEAACNALKGARGSASTTLVQGGVVYRLFSRKFLQPYLKGVAGLAFTPSSTIEMRSTYGAFGDTALILTIYKDDGWKQIRPTWTAAVGVSTAPSSGYQLRLEIRESWLPLGIVTGPTSGQGFVPPHRTVIKGFTSVLVGFDIVLEKRRGRRY